MWQCFFVTVHGENRGPFKKMSEEQGQKLQRLIEGWEPFGVTVLTNGWLYLAFRRFIPVETPAPAVPDNQYI